MDSVTAQIAELLNAPLPGASDSLSIFQVLLGCGDNVPTGRAVGAWREFSYGPEVHWYRLSDSDILGYDCVSSELLPLWPSESDLESNL